MRLVREGAAVRVYDPIVVPEDVPLLKSQPIRFTSSVSEAVDGAQAVRSVCGPLDQEIADRLELRPVNGQAWGSSPQGSHSGTFRNRRG